MLPSWFVSFQEEEIKRNLHYLAYFLVHVVVTNELDISDMYKINVVNTYE